MKEFIIKAFRFFERFIKFSIVGLTNSVIYFVVYYILLYFGVYHLIANTAGYFAGSINGYLMSRFWVFKDTSSASKQSVLKFYVVYGSSLLLSNALVALFVDVMGISDKIAPVLTICFTTPYNYFLQKIWTFREKKQTEENDTVDVKNT